jgi:hypothetical protein
MVLVLRAVLDWTSAAMGIEASLHGRGVLVNDVGGNQK